MYRRFQLKIKNLEMCPGATCYSLLYNLIYPLSQNTIQEIITKKILQGSIIDATSLQNDWFPKVQADIFISHSHSDKEIARKLSTWLYQTFGLRTFIDSDVWGDVNDLLKKIDDETCCDKDRNIYDYNTRNYSTANVHAMLSNALITMIDKAECLFFLNTPNSIHVKNTVEHQTESPWLYLELTASKLLRQRKSSKPGQKEASSHFQYDIDLTHLLEITANDLSKWQCDYKLARQPKGLLSQTSEQSKNKRALDVLYDLYR